VAELLIVARSGRALATSAYQAGYKVHVLDCFADEDTKTVSKTTHQLQYHCEGFDKTELMEQVKGLVSCYPKAMLVVGSGFENTPELLESLAEIIPVMSNDKSTIHSLKDPVALYDLLRRASIKVPEISLIRPSNSEGWLLKEIAGIGGGHVKWLSQINLSSGSGYYQKYISGNVLSAVFLARETYATLVGINEQLQSKQFNEMPFLFKGAVKLNSVDEQHRQNVIEIINKITKRTGLKGLCGVDYIVEDSGEIVVLEVNPRPPSSFELHEQQSVLFDAHLACFEGKEIDCQFSQDNQSKGYVIYYAKQDIKINSNIVWPSWVKDKPSIGSTIAEKSPVCTVHAEDESARNVKAVLQKQLNYIETVIMAEQHAA
jgi:predicted ATP-grasp superfamily ATP-dependent carboligase